MHMTDLMTYPHTTSHISFKSQVFSTLLTTYVRSTEERFAMDPCLRRQEDRRGAWTTMR